MKLNYVSFRKVEFRGVEEHNLPKSMYLNLPNLHKGKIENPCSYYCIYHLVKPQQSNENSCQEPINLIIAKSVIKLSYWHNNKSNTETLKLCNLQSHPHIAIGSYWASQSNIFYIQ